MHDRYCAETDELHDLLQAGKVLQQTADPFNPPASFVDYLKGLEALTARAKRTNNALSDGICSHLHAREALSDSSHATGENIPLLEETIGKLKSDYAVFEGLELAISGYWPTISSW